MVTLTKRAHCSRPPRLLQEEHGCLERGACSLWDCRCHPTWAILGLYKICVHLFLWVQESIIPSLPPAHLHYPHYCETIARRLRTISTPPALPLYAIHHTLLVMTISSECQGNPGFGIHCHPLDSVNPGFILRAPLVNPLDSRTGIHKMAATKFRLGFVFFSLRGLPT